MMADNDNHGQEGLISAEEGEEVRDPTLPLKEVANELQDNRPSQLTQIPPITPIPIVK